jgi:hypothetical protein
MELQRSRLALVRNSVGLWNQARSYPQRGFLWVFSGSYLGTRVTATQPIRWDTGRAGRTIDIALCRRLSGTADSYRDIKMTNGSVGAELIPQSPSYGRAVTQTWRDALLIQGIAAVSTGGQRIEPPSLNF